MSTPIDEDTRLDAGDTEVNTTETNQSVTYVDYTVKAY